MKVVICGDLVPTESNMDLFEQAAAEQIIGQELVEVFKNSDVCLCNLETPAVDTPKPIVKCGPNLITSTKSLSALPAMGLTVVNLANNHILDQDEQGIECTVKELEKRGLSYFGAGMNASLADSCYFYNGSGRKIGIYGIAEHEFSIATEASAGANPYDPLQTFDRLKSIKKECDYLIVLYHGGIEEYRYPSPGLQKVCRKLVESGADLVVCQHSHCIGCEEEYRGATIVYGQGNFIFDRKDNEFWENGLLIELELGADGVVKKYRPIVKKGGTVRPAEGGQKEAILSQFCDRSRRITDDRFIEKEYARFAKERALQYLCSFRGKKGFVQKVLNRIFGERWVLSHYAKSNLIRMRNYLECEAHAEAFAAAVRQITRMKEQK